MSVLCGNPPRCPRSDMGDALCGGEKIKIYQDWGGQRHYLCQNGEGWTTNAARSGTWVVQGEYNFFDFMDGVKLMRVGRPVEEVKRFEQTTLFSEQVVSGR